MQSETKLRRKILFLYFELAGYTVACIEHLAATHPADIHVVRYPVNPVAPFQFTFSEGIKTYERKDYADEALIELCHSIQPDVIYVCGWSDKGYVKAAAYFRKSIPVILTFDNPWLGTIKQHIATLAGPFYLKKIFTHCWVPGEPNAKYARKLGFKEEDLLQGLYSADVSLFHKYNNANKEEKNQKFPHRFIYVGRYTELKGVRELWSAFASLSDGERKGWELWCLGKGELEQELPSHPAIKNCGFVQPSDLSPYMKSTGVFILPAHYEHWGVVVHEFAAAGFPMICTTTTSAASAFLKENQNGFFTEPRNTTALKESIIKIINSSDAQLIEMGNKSVELSNKITPDTWSSTLWRLAGKK